VNPSAMATPEQQQGNRRYTVSTWKLAAGAAAVMILNALHCAFYWNRFLGPSISGLFLEFAARFRMGAVPYRDFFMVIPPLYMLKTAVIMSLFGPAIIAERATDIAMRCLLAGLVFVWLARVVRLRYAFLGTVLGIVLFSSDTADSFTSYHHEAVFWAAIGGFLLSCAGRRRRLDLLVFGGAGACAAISFLSKQTTGAGITVALAIVVAALARRGPGGRGLVPSLGTYLAGWAIPVGIVTGWLAVQGAFHAFVTDAFITGPSSKGSIGKILLRSWFQTETWLDVVEIWLAVAIAGLLYVIVRKAAAGTRDQAPDSGPWVWVYGALCAAAICGGAALSYAGIRPPGASLFGECENFALRIGLMGSAALAVYYTLRMVRGPLNPAEWQRWLLSVVSVTISYTLSLSWPTFGPMAFPSLALVVAVMLNDLAPNLAGIIVRRSVAVCAVALLAIATYQRVENPFSWVGWADPPAREAVAYSRLPQLAGIRMAPSVAEFTDTLTKLIVENSHPGDPVFIFAFQPLFYVLSDRWPPTMGQMHFFDVASDALCRADAVRLRRAKPAVLVDFVMPPAEFRLNEQIFRQGARSGQRDLYDTMYEMIRSGYRLASVLREPGSGHAVRVFVRNPAARPGA
jgi:hypothetical protein